MPVLFLKALGCENPIMATLTVLNPAVSLTSEVRLDFIVDGIAIPPLRQRMTRGTQWILNRSFSFQQSIRLRLFFEFHIGDAPLIGDITIRRQLTHRRITTFTNEGSKYHLYYEVFPDGIDRMSFHRSKKICLRQMFGRLGSGFLNKEQHKKIIAGASIYLCHELISLKNMIAFHKLQVGKKGRSRSIKEWIFLHCTPWGEETMIPIESTPLQTAFKETPLASMKAPNWLTVKDEKTYRISGFQHYSYQTKEDSPATHETLDWNWDQIPDPSFLYMLAYGAESFNPKSSNPVPRIHNEWETGSMPMQWRPFWGEYVTTVGRHVWDTGHQPIKTEMHPVHTILREHTSASPLGKPGQLVPVNRAILGMGFSGGFPHKTRERWKMETGLTDIPDDIDADQTDCWPTDLRRHPFRFKLFPPTAKPSKNAVLKYKVSLCEFIPCPSWERVNDFLDLCQNDDPEEGDHPIILQPPLPRLSATTIASGYAFFPGMHLTNLVNPPDPRQYAFQIWDRTQQLPSGFPPEVTPAQFLPQISLKNDQYFDIEVDLQHSKYLVLGYYAIIECGWSETGKHQIHEYSITFESLRTGKTDNNDWHLFYGVNGQWGPPFWTNNNDAIEYGQEIRFDQNFQVRTIDDMPLVIRDCGIEYDDDLFGSKLSSPMTGAQYLDRVQITVPGPLPDVSNSLDHFQQIKSRYAKETTVLNEIPGKMLHFKVRGWEIQESDDKEYRHEWTIKIEKIR